MTLQAVLPAGQDTADALTQAQAGDQSAFAELVREYQAMVFGLALNFGRVNIAQLGALQGLGIRGMPNTK